MGANISKTRDSSVPAPELVAMMRHFSEPQVLVSSQGLILCGNPAAGRDLGIESWHVGTRLASLVLEPDENMAEFVRASARSSSPVPGAFTFLAPTGASIRSTCSGGVVQRPREGGGAVLLVRFRLHDQAIAAFGLLNERIEQLNRALRARMLAQKALRESEQRLGEKAILLDAAGEAIMAVDLAGRLVHWNRHAERTHGWTREQVLGRDMTGLLLAEHDRSLIRDVFARVVAGEKWSGEARFQRKGGTPVPVLVNVSPVRTEDGTVSGIVVTASDITERLHWEEQLRQTQTMNAMGRMAGGAAHEFNNLLTTITGFTDLLLTELETSAPSALVVEFAEEVRGAGQKAAGLTAQLLAFSRKQLLLPQVLDARDVLEGMTTRLDSLLGAGVEIVLQTDPRPVWILADAVKVEQVVVNLASNARDAMPDGGTLTIRVENRRVEHPLPLGQVDLVPGQYAVLSIQDTGTGIPAALQARVFDPFFSTKGPGKGKGLGLSTVYGFVEQTGGGLQLESLPGEGTSVTLFFPECEPREIDKAEGLAEAGRSASASLAQSAASPTILVAEDNDGVRAFLVELLPRLGYAVIEAADGAEALECFRRHGGIDLVLSDVIMPVMTGPELASALRDGGSDVPVVFMSGYTDDMLAAGDLLNQGVALLRKPFSVDQLSSYLARAMPQFVRG